MNRRYAFLERERATVEELDRLGAEGWRVVSAQHLDFVRRGEPWGDLPEGWTVLLERERTADAP